jgi:transposase InsO family protein
MRQAGLTGWHHRRRHRTTIPTEGGWLYLATVIDIASRHVVGWATVGHLCTELVADALRAAHRRRRPDGDSRILTDQSLGDLSPEQSLDLPPSRRPPRRLHGQPPRQLRHPTRWSSHNTPL